MRLFEDDDEEARSIIAWTERRLETATSSNSVVCYINMFKKMWKESFGDLSRVPQDFKDKAERLYNELKIK